MSERPRDPNLLDPLWRVTVKSRDWPTRFEAKLGERGIHVRDGRGPAVFTAGTRATGESSVDLEFRLKTSDPDEVRAIAVAAMQYAGMDDCEIVGEPLQIGP